MVTKRKQNDTLIARNPINLVSAEGTITLRQYTLQDAKEAFELIDGNRDHLSQFGDVTASKYPTLKSFEESVRNPKNPLKLRFGIRNDKNILLGSINLTPDTIDPQKAEIGYYLGKEFQGFGYIQTAIHMLTDYAFARLNYEELYAKVAKGNLRSAKVLLVLGYTNLGEQEGDNLIYRKLAWRL